MDELDGRRLWRSRYEWEKVPGYGSPGGKTNRAGLVKKLLFVLPVAFALAYLGHAAYLWSQFGPPTGFCTKCFFYWGEHKIRGGDRHWVEHAPLRWSSFR